MTKNFLLIHGAWHGGWAWDGVRRELERAGHRTLAPDMPGHTRGHAIAGVTLADYVDAVALAVESMDGPVVLVGHSSAGIVLQAAAPRVADRLEHLVFLAAFALSEGISQLDLVPPDSAGMLRATVSDGYIPVMEPLVRHVLMAGDSAAAQDAIIARLTPQPLCLLASCIDAQAFARVQVPRIAIIGERDTSLPPNAFEQMAKDNLGECRTIHIPCGHEGLVTDHELVARALLEAVQAQEISDGLPQRPDGGERRHGQE